MTTENAARFTFRMPKATYSKLKEEATQIGVSVNSLILQILRDWLKQNPPEQKTRN